MRIFMSPLYARSSLNTLTFGESGGIVKASGTCGKSIWEGAVSMCLDCPEPRSSWIRELWLSTQWLLRFSALAGFLIVYCEVLRSVNEKGAGAVWRTPNKACSLTT